MSKIFNITFSDFENITVKTGSLNNPNTWVDVDLSQILSMTVDTNDSMDGYHYLLFFGNSADFIATPSISIKDSQDNTYTANALQGYGTDEFKYYLRFGEEWDGQAFIGYDAQGADIFIPENLFVGDTLVNCGGISSSGGFFVNDFGLIGIYEVDKQAILNIMQNNRYFLNTVGDYGQIVNILDYIKLLYKTHINIESSPTLSTIYINGVGVSAQGKPIENYIIEFETTNIKIQGYYNNVLDNDTEINLNIPYFGLYHLDSNFINHNLKLKFICDLMSNNSICNIYIDDIIIDTVELKTGYEIPLKDLNINETQQRIYSIYNEDCFITLKEKRIANNRVDTIIENTTIQNEIINNNISGFIRCENVKILDTLINDYEKVLIENQLKEGVIL